MVTSSILVIQRRFILSVKFILNEGLFCVFKGQAHKINDKDKNDTILMPLAPAWS